MQQYNAEQVELLAAHFPRRNDASFAWGNAVSGFMMAQNLRALWAGSVTENNGLVDYSGQGRVMSPGTVPIFTAEGLAPIIDFTPNQYLQRISEPGLEIENALTIWTWIKFDVSNSNMYYFSKYYTAAPGYRSYMLYKTNTNILTFTISTDGVNVVTASAPAADYYAGGKWLFTLGRFTPNTEVALLVGRADTGAYTWYRTVAAVPPTVFVSNEALEMGRGNRGSYLNGKMSLPGIAAAALTDYYCVNMFMQTRPMFM